MILEQVSDKT